MHQPSVRAKESPVTEVPQERRDPQPGAPEEAEGVTSRTDGSDSAGPTEYGSAVERISDVLRSAEVAAEAIRAEAVSKAEEIRRAAIEEGQEASRPGQGGGGSGPGGRATCRPDARGRRGAGAGDARGRRGGGPPGGSRARTRGEAAGAYAPHGDDPAPRDRGIPHHHRAARGARGRERRRSRTRPSWKR